MKPIIFTLVFVALTIGATAQFTIVAVKGAAGSPAENLSYPRIKSPNTQAAAIIDSILQMEILNNETIVTDPKKLFNNTVYIQEPDSLAQSGHTSIDYKILLNNGRVLSIQFDMESMGAYPEHYARYFCFNAQTGEIITERDLFVSAGLLYLQSHLVSERKKRIKAILQGPLPNIEDSAFARETYEECNSDAGLGDFVIQQQKILFYKDHCFPHAWRPFDIDLDLNVSISQIRKYLTSKGRKLLGP